jgi:hypothetical protein
MYALARNAWKYVDRDKRSDKLQLLEFDYLAPDSMHELAHALEILQKFTAKAWIEQSSGPADRSLLTSDAALIALGRDLLVKNDPSLASLEITADNFENSRRKVLIRKVPLAYPVFRDLIIHYAVRCLAEYITRNEIAGLRDLQAALPENRKPEAWVNAGGQLIRKSSLDQLVQDIHGSRVKSWQDVHRFYQSAAETYIRDKTLHALDLLNEVHGISVKSAEPGIFKNLLNRSLATAGSITRNILSSREKDYENPFRKMVYENQAEMDKVVGRPDENSFIKNRFEAFEQYKTDIGALISKWNL